MRKSFILHKDSLSIIEEMTDEQCGKFLKALYNYQIKGVKTNVDFALKMALTPFYNQFERDDENYEKTCEARKMAGSKGGKQKVANASNCKQNIANLADSDSKSDSKSDNDSKSKNKKEIIKEKEMLVIESYFQRRSSTPWSDKEIQLYKKLGTIDPDDLKLMTTRYQSKDKYLRRDLKTLLNNWHGELDRARQNNIIVQRKFVPLQTMTGLRDA